MLLNRLIGSCLALSMSTLAFGQLAYRFRNFTITDGLSQSSVTCIVQDDVGTLWIGTQDGLNRFDGKQFEVLNSDNTRGLESEYIHCSHKDERTKLWFGTSNGLTSYDQYREKFITYGIGSNNPLSIEEISEATNGDLWLATSTQGIAKWERKTGKIQLVQTGIPSKRIHLVRFVDKEQLMISTEDRGVFSYNIRTGQWKSVAPRKGVIASWLINDVEAFAGSVHLLSTNKGLWLYDSNNGNLVPFLTEIERELGIIEIADVYLRSADEFYIATQNKGLLTVRKEAGRYTIRQSKQDIFQKNALLFDEINTLYNDENGAIWIGTLRGLSCFDPVNQGFLGIGPSGNLKLGLPSASVWAMAEDPEAKYVYIGTDFAISVLDRAKGIFQQYYLSKGSENKESSIMSLHYVNDHEILVGCTDGLYLLTYYGSNYSFKKIDYKKIENPTSFDRVYTIVPYDEGRYFLATKGGVLLYDHTKKTFTSFVHNPKKPKTTIGAGICRLAFRGIDGTFYFGTSTGGLSVLKKRRNGELVIVPFRFNAQLKAITKDYVSSIYQPKATVLWLGTTGSGLLNLNLRTGNISTFSKKEGLPNNFVYGILPDKTGALWLSTNKGLAKFNPETGTSTNFSEVHGLMSDEFNTGAYMASKSGELFFGGIAGYNFFNPIAMNKEQRPLEIRFTKFKLDGDWLHPGDKGAPFKNTISQVSQIDLPYEQRSFTLHFVASDLMNPQLLEYKYRLKGSAEETILLGNTNEIRFNSLSPGSYRLEVYVRKTDGEWIVNPATMDIEIASPFWWKWWFWLLVLAALALFTYLIIRGRIEQSRREQVRLEMKIVERTKEIRAQNTKIEMQKQIIEQEKNKVEDQKRLLQIEKDKSEKLLRNIIPESTAEELKTKGRASARAYKTVSVLFTDFVGFTKIAEHMKPTELVNRLDVYFRKFDEIIVRNNLEKIKTIGDAYMCAGGVPVRNNTNPIDAVLAAIQIQDYMTRLKNDAIANGTEYWDLRLGINTGEVTAGVIGSERLAYDIWGATVNQAQRMEMMGEPGRVTISGATFKMIEPYFECTFRGKVQSKSKGMIDMFTVERIKPELSLHGEGIYPNERFQQIVNLHLYSSINYYKAERHIIKVLERGLSPMLHYHSIAHTKDVVRAVERYALLEGVTDEGLFLLKSAATYHDAGFVESYEKNEPIGARMAEEILPKYGYSEQHINQIKDLIFVTQIPHQPKNKLEEIICDADLDYLGRDDFHEIADKLRRELKEHGKIDSDRKWDEMQVAFLNMHKYFTQTAIASRQEKKAQNLKEVMERLERGEYAH
jgi:ligand-binding sensor domain-containing protein/class 3 adenylate cyclase/predicted metal-dependent HD superfamily phosphohydrolase